MNASPNVYVPTQLEYMPTFTKIRIFRVLDTSSREMTLAISGRGLPSRLTIPAEGLVLPEGVSIDEEGHFLYQGNRLSLWDEVRVDAIPQNIYGKLPCYTNMPEIDITL